jgi:hypothetical protein
MESAYNYPLQVVTLFQLLVKKLRLQALSGLPKVTCAMSDCDPALPSFIIICSSTGRFLGIRHPKVPPTSSSDRKTGPERAQSYTGMRCKTRTQKQQPRDAPWKPRYTLFFNQPGSCLQRLQKMMLKVNRGWSHQE